MPNNIVLSRKLLRNLLEIYRLVKLMRYRQIFFYGGNYFNLLNSWCLSVVDITAPTSFWKSRLLSNEDVSDIKF